METQISNPAIYYSVCAFIVWGVLGLLALALISLRRDREFVYEDINKFLLKHQYQYRIFSIIMLFLILPLSIPYSIMHITKK